MTRIRATVASRPAASLAVVVVLLVCATTVTASVPRGFIGSWWGVPSYTSVGPHLETGGGVNFTIHQINESFWFMEDSVGRSTSMRNSRQFWHIRSVANSSGGRDTSLFNRYFGYLQSWYRTMPHGGHVNDFHSTKVTDTEMTFLYTPAMQSTARLWLPWNIEWWLTLAPNGASMENWLKLPAGPEYSHHHFYANMTKVSDDPAVLSSPETLEMVARLRRREPLPPAPPAVPLEVLRRTPLRCPRAVAAAAAASADSVASVKVKDEATPPAAGQPLAAAAALAEPSTGNNNRNEIDAAAAPRKFQACVVLNKYHDLRVRFNYRKATRDVEVLVSGVPRAQAAANSWIAVMIMNAWPSMLGGDVILGHFDFSGGGAGGGGAPPTACVRSMYAASNAGTPVPNPKQVLSNGRVFTGRNQDGNETINMAFTRPWRTGNWDLEQGPSWNASYPFIPLPTISWAMGRAPRSCDDAPMYHFGARGTHGWSWPHPSLAIIPESMCLPGQ